MWSSIIHMFCAMVVISKARSARKLILCVCVCVCVCVSVWLSIGFVNDTIHDCESLQCSVMWLALQQQVCSYSKWTSPKRYPKLQGVCFLKAWASYNSILFLVLWFRYTKMLVSHQCRVAASGSINCVVYWGGAWVELCVHILFCEA
jgi:hypothetical protein